MLLPCCGELSNDTLRDNHARLWKQACPGWLLLLLVLVLLLPQWLLLTLEGQHKLVLLLLLLHAQHCLLVDGVEL